MLKKLIAPVVLSGALLGSLAVGGAAFAGTPTAAPAAATAAAGAHHGAGKLRAWLKANRTSIRKAGLTISADTIGITPQQLATELRSGKSIAEVATEHGASASTVEGALTTAADAKVDAAVTAGKITSVQGARITARVPALVAKAVNRV